MKTPAALLAICVCSTSALAQGSFPAGTVGARLEGELRTLTTGCFGDYAKFGPEFLPSDFKTEFGPGQSLRRPLSEARTLEGIQYSYVTRTIVDTRRPIVAQIREAVGRAHAVDIKLPPATPITEADSLIYNLNCASQLKLALDQGFKFSFSLLSNASVGIKQALDFQSNPTARGSIVVMNGVFLSPLHVALTSPDPATRVTAHAGILLYLENARRRGVDVANHGYLRSMKGWMVTLGTNSETSQLLRASLDSNISGFGLEAKIAAQSRVEYSTSLSSTRFLIFLDRELSASEDTEKLPTIASVRNSIQSAAQFYPSSEATYQKAGKFPFRVEIPGVPDWLCLNQWEAQAPDADSVDTVVSLIDPTGKCVLSSTATLSKEIGTLNVSFLNSKRFEGSKASSDSIRVSTRYAVRLAAVQQVARSGDHVITVNRNASVPSYSIEAPFSIFPADTSSQVYLTDKLKLTCDGFDGKSTIYPNQIALDGSSSRYRLNVTVNFAPNAVPSSTCKLTAGIAFTSRIGGTTAQVERDIEIDLLRFAIVAGDA
jgi:hypothetical protein